MPEILNMSFWRADPVLLEETQGGCWEVWEISTGEANWKISDDMGKPIILWLTEEQCKKIARAHNSNLNKICPTM